MRDTPDLSLALVVHPSVFIQEELDARGWSRDRLAYEMSREDCRLTRLALDMYFECGPDHRDLLLGEDMIEHLGTAFGVSPDLFRHLETRWRQGHRSQ